MRNKDKSKSWNSGPFHVGRLYDVEYVIEQLDKRENRNIVCIHLNEYRVTKHLRRVHEMRKFSCQLCGSPVMYFSIMREIEKMQKSDIELYLIPVVKKNNRRLTIDHVIPINKRGSYLYENEDVLCNVCNQQKSDNIPPDIIPKRVMPLSHAQRVYEDSGNIGAKVHIYETMLKRNIRYMEEDEAVDYLNFLNKKFDGNMCFEDMYRLIPEK